MAAIAIASPSDWVEQRLAAFHDRIGADFEAYRGHVYRVISFAMHFLDGKQTHRKLVETALVYHDIGLWTAGDLAYLEPSEELALRDNRDLGFGLDPEALRACIHWHHKMTPYHGPDAEVVNAVRRGDWIEASQGMVRMGLDKARIAAVHAAIDDHGFANVLQRLARDIGGSAVGGNLRVLRHVFKW